MRVVLKRGNDQIVTLKGLRETDTGTYLNDATVKVTMMDSRGTPIPTLQDISMPHVMGSTGNYEWFIESNTMMLPKGVEYSAVFTAEQGGLNYRVVHEVSVIDG